MTRLGEGAVELAAIMARLRVECPWDAEQTHASLVKHLIEESAEVVDAIEIGDDADLREELGDLLLQVFFHAEIARTEGRFDIDDVARGISEKLVRRHPYVFADASTPDDLMGTWESAKQAEKQRTSALEGVPESLSTLARAAKVASRVGHVHLEVGLPDEPITADEVGEAILALVARAAASGVDADQATRVALRALEARVLDAERGAQPDGANQAGR